MSFNIKGFNMNLDLKGYSFLLQRAIETSSLKVGNYIN